MASEEEKLESQGAKEKPGEGDRKVAVLEADKEADGESPTVHDEGSNSENKKTNSQQETGNEGGKDVVSARVGSQTVNEGANVPQTDGKVKVKSIRLKDIADIPSIDSPSGDPSAFAADEELEQRTVYSGVTYLGSSTVDAPCSEMELNRMMGVLKKQASESIDIQLSIPSTPKGCIRLFDAESNYPLSVYRIRHVLFCARGKGDELKDCLSFTTGYRTSTIFHCHVFRCGEEDACVQVLQSIGKAFQNPQMKKDPSPVKLNSNEFDFDVTVDILEEDSKGGFSSVARDKDCLKIRQNIMKRVGVTLTQTSNRQLAVRKCFSILLGSGRNLEHSSLQPMEMVSGGSIKDGKAYEVIAAWNPCEDTFAVLNTETPKCTKLYLTVGVDFVIQQIKDPVRFVREVQVRVFKTTERFWLPNLLRQSNTETFHMTVRDDEDSKDATDGLLQYVVTKLENASLSQRRRSGSFGPMSAIFNRVRETDTASVSDSDQEQEGGEEDDEPLMSGTGAVDTRWTDDQIQSWSTMIGKWDGKSRSKQLVHLIRKGIPDMLRGQVWQMLTGASENLKLLEDFPVLLTKDTPSEQIIIWDINRTFPTHENFSGVKGDVGRDGLYKISKAYSVYDSEIGYCQGFSFLIAVLLLHMPEEQAFTVLVSIMFDYGLRELFKDNFTLLHSYFYQLEKLIEADMPDLHTHFTDLNIEPHMYASQWFITIFTVKFPLPFVYRIMDMVLCEGLDTIFRVALALLKASRSQLLQQDFEGVLNHFRVALPKRYSSEKETNQLIAQAASTKVDRKKLKKLEKEYQAMKEAEAAQEDPVARLERENKRLQEANLRLEQENDTLAQELVASKISLRQDMDKLEQRIDRLSKERRMAVEEKDSAGKQAKQSLEEAAELRHLYQKAVLELEMERQHHQAEMAEYKQMCQQLDERNQQAQEDLNQELLEVKARLGNSVSERSTDGANCHDTPGAPVNPSMLSSEQRLRELEMELAHYKLQLVEAECRSQDLERKLKASSSPSTTAKKGFLSRLKSFNS